MMARRRCCRCRRRRLSPAQNKRENVLHKMELVTDFRSFYFYDSEKACEVVTKQRGRLQKEIENKLKNENYAARIWRNRPD